MSMQLTLSVTVGRVRPPSSVPGTLTIQPDATAGIDTFTRKDGPSTNSGTATNFRVVGSGGSQAIALLKFDLSALPVGAVVTRARLYLTSMATMPATTTHYVNRILPANSVWTELGATWDYAVASSVRWAGDAALDGGADAGCSVPGTDFSATDMGSFVVNGEPLGTEFTVELDLTEFAAMVSANYGFVVRGVTTSSAQFRSSDNATASSRPKLVIDYETP